MPFRRLELWQAAFFTDCLGLPTAERGPRLRGVLSLGAASLFFLLIHFGVSGTRLRDALVKRLGEGPYRGLFSFASLVGLVWMSIAFAKAPNVELWPALPAALPIAKGLVLIAFLFVMIGLTTKNPTSVGTGDQLARADTVRGMLRITRHPFLWGTALWALVHVVMNGELRALVLFGSLALLAVGGTASIDRKRRRNYGADWQRFAIETSNLPFAAILSGRNLLLPALREIGWWRPLVAVAVYLAVLMLHGPVIGKPLVY